MPIRILVADDHVIVRQSLKALLEENEFDVVGEAGDGHEAVRLAQSLRPDVAILDLAMPRLNGLDAAQEIMRVSPVTRPILLTMYNEDRYVAQALRAGIKGYVMKSQAAADLKKGIHEVLHGAIFVSSGISRAVVDTHLAKLDIPPDPLTSRERQVLQLVAEGKTTKEIAAVLGISTKTAESHRIRLMAKLNIHETANLVRYAIREGIIQP